MYTFSCEIDKQAVIDFVNRQQGQYFQLPMWAEVKNNWTYHLFSGQKDGELVLTCLCLERKIPFCGRLWYSPCGFAGDYTDMELVDEFSRFMKVQMKKNRVFTLVIDPPIEEWIDHIEQPVAAQVISNLTKCGWQHNRDNNNYTYQPTMTVMVPLVDGNGERATPEGLLKRFEKGVRYSVRVGESRGLKSESFTYADVQKDEHIFDLFMDVMGDTSERLEFIRRPREYYMGFLQNFAPWAVLDLVYYDKLSDTAQNNAHADRVRVLDTLIEAEEKPSIKNKLMKEKAELAAQIQAYEQRYEEACKYTKQERLYVAAGLTISFGGISGCVFGGTKNVLRNILRASHYLNFLRIVRSIGQGNRLHDMGRVPHSYIEESSSEHGLFLFKMSFCSSLHEYIGEYALVRKKGAYFRYYHLMPLVRNYRQRMIRFFKKLIGR